MKRVELIEPFDASEETWRRRRVAQADAWKVEETWWQNLGIDRLQILHRLLQAGRDRAAYEARLRASQQHTTEATRFSPKGQQVRRVLAAAKPFIELMKVERDHLAFGGLGEEVERAVRAYRERYLLDRKDSGPVRNPRHRLGEEWLVPYVKTFASLFRKKGISRRRIERGIHEMLLLAGHGDVVSPSKIHRLVGDIWPELQKNIKHK